MITIDHAQHDSTVAHVQRIDVLVAEWVCAPCVSQMTSRATSFHRLSDMMVVITILKMLQGEHSDSAQNQRWFFRVHHVLALRFGDSDCLRSNVDMCARSFPGWFQITSHNRLCHKSTPRHMQVHCACHRV